MSSISQPATPMATAHLAQSPMVNGPMANAPVANTPMAMPNQIPNQMPNQMAAMDPLAQLHDIHLPEAINQYPIAPGWWLLLLALLAIFTVAAIKLYRYHQRCQVKKQAIATIKNNHLNDSDIVATLKWACLSYFPRQQVANLYGLDFQKFLTEQLTEKHQAQFTKLVADSMTKLYQAQSCHSPSFEQAALLWLTQALPTKPKTAAEKTAPAPEKAEPAQATQSASLGATL